MKRFLPIFLLSAALGPFPARAQDGAARKYAYGIVLLTNGNGPQFNDQVSAMGKQMDKKVPTEVSFGIYVKVAQVRDIQAAVDRLAARRVKKIVVVPLLLHSDSRDMDQARFALGLEDNPADVKANAAEENPMAGGKGFGSSMNFPSDFSGDQANDTRVHTQLPLVLAGALDDAPQVADILLARAKALSHDPAHETVILLGLGPADNDRNKAQLKTLDSLGQAVKEKGRFKAAASADLRLDAGQDAKDAALQRLRRLVEAADQDGGSALLVPAMLSLGSVEKDLLADSLQGSFYAWDGRTLLPDPKLAAWALEDAAASATEPDVRKYK